jgi:hypothetical protein
LLLIKLPLDLSHCLGASDSALLLVLSELLIFSFPLLSDLLLEFLGLGNLFLLGESTGGLLLSFLFPIDYSRT